MKLPTVKITFLMGFFLISLYGCFSNDGQAEESTPIQAMETVTKAVQKTTTNLESEFVEGKHYFEIFPEMNTNVEDGKIEVLELFWLGCPHCYTLEPTMARFKKSKPDDVHFDQVPATLNPSWAFHARLLYTAQILDPKGNKGLINKLFKAMHKDRIRLNKLAQAISFFEKQGVNKIEFNNAYNSMAMSAKMSYANTVSAGSQATAVPTLIINGKYRTSPYAAGGEEKLLKLLNMLIQQERE